MATKPEYPGTLNAGRANQIGLVGSWLFNKGDGVVAKDTSGFANDGAFQGAPQWVAGNFDGAIYFQGVNQYIQVPGSDSLDITNNITIWCWLKFPAVANIQDKMFFYRRASANAAYQFRFGDDGASDGKKLIFQTNTAVPAEWKHAYSDINVITDTNWNLYAVSCTGGVVSMFKNDVELDVTGSVHATFDDGDLGCISARPAGGDYANWTMDHICICNKALAKSKIDILYADPFWAYGAEARAPRGVCRRPFQPEW